MTGKMKSLSTTTLILVGMATTDNSRVVTAQSNPRPAPGTAAAAAAAAAAKREPITCPQVPTLHCKNGSTCEEGVANFGKQHDHLDLQTHEAGYYCKCVDGYIGHECGIQVDDCDGSTGYDPSDPTGVLRSCYHGSKCRSSGVGFYCDCNKLNYESVPTATKFAGLMCQHESTSLCAASLAGEGRSPNEQFCTNHGKCVKMVTGDEPHPGCVCREGWMGDHCEVRDDPLLANAHNGSNQARGKSWAGIVLFSLLMISMGGVSIYIMVILVKKNTTREGVDGCGGNGENKKVVGMGDLDADGSGTLGRSATNNGDGAVSDIKDFAIGDLELTSTDKDESRAEDSNEPGIV